MTRETYRVLPDLSAKQAFKKGAARPNYVRNSLKAKAEGLPALREKIARNEKRLAKAEKQGNDIRAAHLRNVIATQQTNAYLLASELAQARVNIPVPALPEPTRAAKYRLERKEKRFKRWGK